MQAEMTCLDHGVYVLDAHYVQKGVASIYLIEQDSKVAIIETGTAHSIPHVFAALQEIGLTPDDVEYVIPTHIHLDHAAGAGGLMEKCPNAKLIIHPRGAQHMINPEKLEAGTMAVYGEEKYRKLYGSLKPIDEAKVIVADDNYELDFHGRKLTFIDTPGHALHHFCIHDDLSNGIFTGDTFGLAYKNLKPSKAKEFIFVTTTPVHFDPQALQQSISRLLALNPDFMYLTHFGAIKPTASVVEQLEKSLKAFVDIAESEKANEEDRVERMQQRITDWLLAEYVAAGGGLPETEVKKWLENDCNLNAQGIEVWLRRRAKQQFQAASA